MTQAERQQRIAALTGELENLQRSLPAHSLKPAMLIRIEELEEDIETLKREASNPALDVSRLTFDEHRDASPPIKH